MEFPKLTNGNIILDEIKLDDAESIFDIFSNEEVTKYYDLESFKSIEQAENLIKLVRSRFNKSLGIRWAIRLNSSNKCIGTCGFNSWNKNSHSTVIGYDLNQKHWGKGIITKSLTSIITSAFSGNLACKKINRIQADTVPGNTASEVVLNKLGFKEEGLIRESAYWKNSYHDLKCFGLLKSEFNKKYNN